MVFDALIDSVYAREDYPATAFQTESWGKTRPLEGVSVLDATPVFRNTLVKYRALLAAGARLTIGISEGVVRDEAIVSALRGWGFPVVTPENATGNFDLVLDCAGQFVSLSPRCGFVELTRSGVPRYAGCPKPVWVADSGRIKRIETGLGTGDGYFRAMESLGYRDFENKAFVVFGSGKVGAGIMACALLRGAQVSVVTDTRLGCATPLAAGVRSVVDFRDTPSVVALIQSAAFIVTATGHRDALGAPEITAALLHSSAVLANMGVEDEYGTGIPETRVLHGKRPLNFILEEPTQLRFIDATFALDNALALRLAAAPASCFPGLHEPPVDLEDELLEITRQKGTIPEDLLREFVKGGS